jgi:uncharacterized protein YbjT (DUF2867 family)
MTGDLARAEGIDAAVSGIEVVVHCAASLKRGENKAQLQNLVRAARPAGVQHLVLVSVVGTDRVPIVSGLDRAIFGYFALMSELEGAISGSRLPWSILRATQFYEAVLLIARGLSRLPVIPVPAGLRFQPVDTRDVAARLVELALGEPAGLAPDVAGPRIYAMDELVRAYLRSVGRRRLLLPVPIPGKAARAVREGAILAPERAVGRRTWEEFLAERAASRGEPGLNAS